MNALGTFVDADELYYNFTYLSPKNVRRDALGAMHSSLMDEFQKCLQPFELHAKSSTLPLPRRREAEYFAKLILDSSYVVKTHTHMVTLYRTLANPQANIQYVELIKFLDKVERQVNNHVTHPDLANIKVNINTELYILHKLFLAEAQMMLNHQFRETLFNIYQSRADLLTWKSRMERDGGKPASNPYAKLPLYLWLSEFIGTMLSKATLFFFKPLWREERMTGAPDMRSQVARLDCPFPLWIESFCAKTDCTFFCLVLHAEGMTSYSPDGYECPDPSLAEIEPEPLTGMKSYPVIFSVPYIDEVPLPTAGLIVPPISASSTTSSFSAGSKEPSSAASLSAASSSSGPIPSTDTHLIPEHLPSIVILLEDNVEELNLFKPKPLIVHYASRKAQDPGVSYALFRVAQKITAVAVFKRKIKPDDSTDTMLTELRGALTSNVRNARLFSRLIPKD